MNLTRDQQLAAMEASRIMLTESVDRDEARASYRAAVDRLRSLLPDGADVAGIVLDVARWDIKNEIASIVSEQRRVA